VAVRPSCFANRAGTSPRSASGSAGPASCAASDMRGRVVSARGEPNATLAGFKPRGLRLRTALASLRSPSGCCACATRVRAPSDTCGAPSLGLALNGAGSLVGRSHSKSGSWTHVAQQRRPAGRPRPVLNWRPRPAHPAMGRI
jgi:hypothetical protein